MVQVSWANAKRRTKYTTDQLTGEENFRLCDAGHPVFVHFDNDVMAVNIDRVLSVMKNKIKKTRQQIKSVKDKQV